MQKPHFTIDQLDIASANMGWLVAQLLLGTMVTKKIMTAQEAKDMLLFCESRFSGNAPNRGLVRIAANEALDALLKQYDVPSPDRQH